MNPDLDEFTPEEQGRRRRIWFQGLLFLLILAAACIAWAVWRIPRDIEARALDALGKAGLDPRVQVEVEGRRIILSGEVENAVIRARMATLAAGVRGAGDVVDRLSVRPHEAPPARPPAPAAVAPAPGAAAPVSNQSSPPSAAGTEVAANPPPPPAQKPAAAPPATPAASGGFPQPDVPLRPVAALKLPGLNFRFNSTRLTAPSAAALRRTAAELTRHKELRLELTGHTDSAGDQSYNRLLSARRAEAVARRLIAAGVSPERLRTRGLGDAQPLADNRTREGRALNRRVELTLW